MATKRSSEENLDDEYIVKVIALLEAGGTKKAACELLNIKYNTSRLDKLISEYKDRLKREKEQRALKRGKPATDSEIGFIITSYLEGEAVDKIAKALYRSSTFVGSVLTEHNVPKRNKEHSYFRPALMPDFCVKEKFSSGELAYSMRYDSLATIKHAYSPGVYLIYLLSDKQKQFAYQPAEELASLTHLSKWLTNTRA